MRAILVLALLLAPLAAAPAVEDERGDVPAEAGPDFDLLRVDVSETAEDLRFTLTVDGAIRAPVGGLHEYVIEFRLLPPELYRPAGGGNVGHRHAVSIGTWGSYIVSYAGLGTALPQQPGSGVATATWIVPKASLHVGPWLRRPLAGDWIADARVTAQHFGSVADTVALPDARLAVDRDAGEVLHLRAEGRLSREPPPAGPGTASVAAAWDLANLEWRSEALPQPLPLGDLGATLWIATTASTPVVANEDLRVYLWDEAPDGSRRLVAARPEELPGRPEDSFTNLFLLPGLPQRMPFALRAATEQTEIAAGRRAVLDVRVGGYFGYDSGPLVVFYDGAERESVLVAG